MSISKIVEEFNRVQAEFRKSSQVALKEVFTSFFNENPKIAYVTWTQYTPYFADGDECTFGVNEMYASIAELTEEDEGEYIEDRTGVFSNGGRWKDEEFNTQYAAEIANFSVFNREINQLPDDIFLQTFGNHCSIRATKTGFDVEEYEHE